MLRKIPSFGDTRSAAQDTVALAEALIALKRERPDDGKLARAQAKIAAEHSRGIIYRRVLRCFSGDSH